MQVNKIPIFNFLEGSGKSFIIPVYQRDYAWQKENCEKLWNDLLSLRKNEIKAYFLGTIVIIDAGFQEYSVIDGQQRLTTISLLLLALQNYLKKNKIDEGLQDQLSDYLIDRHSKRIRLKPNKQDKAYFDELFNGTEIEEDSNIVSNYNFFYHQIQKDNYEAVSLFEAFRKLEIVLITLDKGQDDPQLIFESLNSTGVGLNDGDLIRNYILMDLDNQEQENFYTNYWLKIEKFTNNNIAEFVRNYLMFKLNISVKQTDRDTYYKFREYTKNKFKNKEFILKDLIYFAKIYSYCIQKESHKNKQINHHLERLFDLEFKVCYPYLLDILEKFDKKELPEEEIVLVLKLIESYAFRRIIVEGTNQGLNKFFIIFAKEIQNKLDAKIKYSDTVSSILLSKSANLRFPDDESLINALETKEVYKFNRKNKNFLFHSLENYNSEYKVELDDLTIEHIMPQRLTAKDKQKLGENYQEIHKKYLHTIGNLRLTANNSKMGNKGFQEKQEIDSRANVLNLNKGLNKIEEWNEKEIVKRAKNLAEIATKVWIYPVSVSEYEQEKEVYDLDENTNFTGKKPKTLYIENKPFQADSWKDILKIICKSLYEKLPTEFKQIITNSELKKYFALENESSKMRARIEFTKNHFIEGNLSANGIISFIIKLSSLVNYDYSNIQIETVQNL